jgi:hypothetical protein
MGRARNLSLSLLLLATGPAFWLACGGGKPAESPADENSGGDDSGSAAPADSSSELPATAGSASSAAAGGDDSSSSPASSSASAAASPPTTPPLGGSDCGKCIDKTCAKPAAACGKNTDCQAMVDAIHGCNGAAASCIDGATAPTAAKPKKLAAAYGKCAKKAIAKACKAQCQ